VSGPTPASVIRGRASSSPSRSTRAWSAQNRSPGLPAPGGAGAEPQAGAPRLLGPVEGDFRLSARVRCTFAGAFDAGALLLWAGERTWAKLAFEVSPDGEPMVVSVITDRRASDDANAFVVSGEAVWLRLSRRGTACALHARPEGDTHFALIDPAAWEEVARVRNPAGPDDSADFSYVTFRRRQQG